MAQYYVGLDVHSKQSVFEIQEETGKVVMRGEVATTPEGLLPAGPTPCAPSFPGRPSTSTTGKRGVPDL